MTKRRIYLVDDDAAIRRSAAFMLKSSGFLVDTFENGVLFLKQAKALPPGCVLLDVRMPEMDGLSVQQAMQDAGVLLPVVVMTGHGDVAVAVRAMKAGAVDFIEKPFDKASILASIDEAFHRLNDAERHKIRTADAVVRLEALTQREREVLVGMVAGLPNKAIGYDLGISPRTVEIHRANVMTKLGVRSFSEALRIAFAAGIGEETA